jgi:fatty acid desaturase
MTVSPGTHASDAELRRRAHEQLPGVFAPQPRRALYMVPLVALAWTGNAALLFWPLPWPARVALALLVGHSYGCGALLAHECLHGSTVRAPWLQRLLGYAGLAPLLVSPTLWLVWHNRVHHGNTNSALRDPDHFGTLRRYRQARSTRAVHRLAPGSGSLLSYAFVFYWFTFHTQIVLLLTSKHSPLFVGLRRRLAIAETLAFAGVYAALGVAAGPLGALLVVVLPLAVGNFVVMVYLATNHFMRPLTTRNDALDNSMSVRTWPLLDALHFRFSHHVEHHMFPRVSSRFYPQLRAFLQREARERYVCPSHLTALRYLYSTPRIYLDAKTLVHPEDLQRKVDTDELAEALKSA